MRTRLFGEFSTSSPLFYIAVYAPGITALILTGILDGRTAVTRLLATLRPRWASAPYYAAVLLGWPILDSIALFAQGRITGDLVPRLDYHNWYLAPGFLLMTLATDPGPLGEELGWRGYALPRLLSRLASPLNVALILGVVWGLWHLPAFIISGTAQHDTAMGALWLILGTTLTSVIMTWLYRRTSGDVLASGLLVHLMNNVMLASVPFMCLVYVPVAVVAAIALIREGRTQTAVGSGQIPG